MLTIALAVVAWLQRVAALGAPASVAAVVRRDRAGGAWGGPGRVRSTRPRPDSWLHRAAVFCLSVAMVVLTSRWWRTSRQTGEGRHADGDSAAGRGAGCWPTPNSCVGAVLRHSPHLTGDSAAPIFHVAGLPACVGRAVVVAHGMPCWRCRPPGQQLRGLSLGPGGALVDCSCFWGSPPGWSNTACRGGPGNWFGDWTFVEHATDAVRSRRCRRAMGRSVR